MPTPLTVKDKKTRRSSPGFCSCLSLLHLPTPGQLLLPAVKRQRDSQRIRDSSSEGRVWNKTKTRKQEDFSFSNLYMYIYIYLLKTTHMLCEKTCMSILHHNHLNGTSQKLGYEKNLGFQLPRYLHSTCAGRMALPNTQCMVYLPTSTIKIAKCKYTIHWASGVRKNATLP